MPTTVSPLADALATIPDFLQAQGRRHPLLAMLLLACAAMLCGATGECAIAEWAANYGQLWRERLDFTHQKGPHQSTVHRVLKRVDCAALEAVIVQWRQQVRTACPLPDPPLPCEAMALDGKTLRPSSKGGAANAHLLSALSQRLSVVLGQVAVPDKRTKSPRWTICLARWCAIAAW